MWLLPASPGSSPTPLPYPQVLLNYLQCFRISERLFSVGHLGLSLLCICTCCVLCLEYLSPPPPPRHLCLLTPPHASKSNSDAIPFSKPTVSLLLRWSGYSKQNLHLLKINCQDYRSTLPSCVHRLKNWQSFLPMTGSISGLNALWSSSPFHWEHWDWKQIAYNCYSRPIWTGEDASHYFKRTVLPSSLWSDCALFYPLFFLRYTRMIFQDNLHEQRTPNTHLG